MSAAAFIQIALVSTSATIALILAIAWYEFGRPRHAFTWSLAFAVAALMWAIGLVPLDFPATGRAAATMTYALAGFPAALNTIGFRQRAGVQTRGAILLFAAAANALLVLLLAAAGESGLVQLIPVNLFGAMTFYLAARTLHGRRKSERAAERVAETGLLLLALLSVAVLTGLIAAVAGATKLELGQLGGVTLLMLPGIIAGIGLFTIILLAADLADQARRLAATDMLTGLLNRRGFEDAANILIDSARRHDRTLTLVLMDLDRFKQVNDLFGHPAGDRVLCAICDTLSNGIGPRDVLARFGGEEFALILMDVDIATATETVEMLRRAVERIVLDLPRQHRMTASFGVAALRADDKALTSIIKRADAALYRSKAQGRNRVTVAGEVSD